MAAMIGPQRASRYGRRCRWVGLLALLVLAVALACAFNPASNGGASRLIAFAALTGKHSDIYSSRTDGTGRVALTRGGNDEYCPTWSPDGRSIALVVQQPSTSPITGGGWIEVITASGKRR